jgi:hypothetical protein
MQDHHDAADADTAPARRRELQSDILLRVEIGFWRDLLAAADHSVAAESIERMQQALALAERRLLQLFGKRAVPTASSNGPESTSDVGPHSLH